MEKYFRIILAIIASLVIFFLWGNRTHDYGNFFRDEIKIKDLSVSEIIKLTNTERSRQGLEIFHENQLLNEAAEIKLEDMIINQYFDHESLSGEEAGDLARFVGYDFIAVGENLAKGNFINEHDLVKGWMESPGHRENILHSGYREIGVAVGKAGSKGEEFWLAVQIFGLPSWVCSSPDKFILNEITWKQEEIEALEIRINILKKEIKAVPIRNNREIEEYNALVSKYNNLMREIGNLVNEYNSQINATNKCIESYGF